MAAPIPEADASSDESDSKLSGYHWKLLIFLSVATFFEGYDFLALSQILPNLREDMALSETWSGIIVGCVNAGTVAAFWLVRKADQIGRRRLLTITILGYTLFTFASGFAPNVYVFIACQFVARIFLIGEWAVSMVIAAEEFPSKHRAMIIGFIQAMSSFGSIVCAGVVPLLLKTEYSWRMVYFVGIVPLLILMYARRNLRETKKFQEVGPAKQTSLFRIWKTPYRKRVLALALIWFVAYIPAQNAVAFWKEFALAERGFTDEDVGLAIMIAALVAMPLMFAGGKVVDTLGRRGGAVVIFGLGTVGVICCYVLEGFWPLTMSLMLGIFAATAYMYVLNAYNTELFPTELRGDAFAWSNNLLGRIGYVASPFLVGYLAEETGAFGPVVASTGLFNIVAVILIFRFLPETKGLDLDETSRLPDEPTTV